MGWKEGSAPDESLGQGVAAGPDRAPWLPGRGMAGVFVLSLAILVMEVTLTRILSVVMWYHFAFVVISLAMLGLAIAGVGLYLFPGLLRRAESVIPWSCLLAGVSTAGTLVHLVRTPFQASDAASIFSADVALTCLIILAPFVFGGLAISAALSRYLKQVNTVYLADLVGAGLGCVVVVLLIDALGAPAAMVASAFLFAAAGALFRRSAGFGSAAAHWVMALAVALGTWHVASHGLEPVYNKGYTDEQRIGTALDSWWNSHSCIKVYEVPKAPDIRVIDIDGNASTGILKLSGPATPERVAAERGELRYWIGAPPYAVIREKPEVLIIGPGGGREILTGLLFGATVTAVEINGIIHGFMTSGPYADFSGGIYTAPGVTVHHDEARSWIRRSDRKFDLIQATLVDTWAATASGAFALSENALYTVEAFEDYWNHLTGEGVVHFTRWHREPPRESLRTLSLMVEVMRRHGITEPARHVVVLLDPLGLREGGHKYTSMIWSKRPFDDGTLERLKAWGEARAAADATLALEPVCAPGLEPKEDLGRYLAAADKDAFVAGYRYDIRPTTDDRPFFFNTVRLTDVASFQAETYQNEQAVVVLVTVLLTVTGIVLLAFVLPFLFALRRIRSESGRGTWLRLLYFCGLGVGFMLVEIPVLQRFGLYLGHPTYAITTVLATLLIGTGIGSFVGGKVFGNRPVVGARVGLILLVGAIVALVTLVPDLLRNTLSKPLHERVFITVALLGPLGILMGFPFPLGVRSLERERAGLVPWAWGMNGATSVLASVLGVAIGMYAGFTIAALVAAGAYLVCLLTAGLLASPRPARVEPTEVLDVT